MPETDNIEPLWVNITAIDLDITFSNGIGTAFGDIYRKAGQTTSISKS